MDGYARIALLREVWFQPTGYEAEPTPWRIYQQAAAVARMTNLPDGYEELPKLAESLAIDARAPCTPRSIKKSQGRVAKM